MVGKKKLFTFIFLIFFVIVNNSIAMEIKNIDVSKMSVTQKIGQMIMLDFSKWKKEGSTEESLVTSMNNEIKEIIKNYHIGNIILYAPNVYDGVEKLKQSVNNKSDIHELRELICSGKFKEKLKQLIRDFKKLEGNGIPMIFAIDQEGGEKVQKIKSEGPVYCTLNGMRVKIVSKDGIYNDNGRIGSNEEAYKKGEYIGRELKSLGINCNLAPVADICGPSTVIGIRSFGEDPKIVSERCVSFLEGLSKFGILGTAKHFPGLGCASEDSHFELPKVYKSIEELKNCEFVPFKNLINNNIGMIMTAHVLLPKIDAEYPATLSKKILGVLRTELKYKGVIITDSMKMGAIVNNFEKLNACKLAIQAGADILCRPVILRSKEDVSILDELYRSLQEKIKNDSDFSKLVDESVTRILILKERLKNK